MTKSKKNNAGLCYPASHPSTKRWKVDADYIHKLSQEEREWYGKFLAETVSATFGDDPLITDPEERKALAHENYAAHNDIFNVASRVSEIFDNELAVPAQPSTPPRRKRKHKFKK